MTDLQYSRKHIRKNHGNIADDFWDPAQRGVRVISCFYGDIRKFFNVWTSFIFLYNIQIKMPNINLNYMRKFLNFSYYKEIIYLTNRH